MEVYIHFTPRF